MIRAPLAVAALFLCSSFEASAGADALAERALAELEQSREELFELADRLWEIPELAHHEARTERALTDALRAAGFRVEESAGGLPTAFRASYGEGRPVIGIVALLDALPGLSQRDGVSERDPLEPDAPGHGCGHHLIAAADLGAAVALRSALEERGGPGTVVLFGAPAEEIYHGGVYMVREGVFDDLDAILFWHPSSITAAISRSGLAMESVRFVFTGRPSDATDAAGKGRNALRAVEMLVTSEAGERDRFARSSVVNHVLETGGGIPSVVPERAAAWYFVHGRDLGEVGKIRERLDELARRSEEATGTRLETQLLSRTKRWLINRALVELIGDALDAEPQPDVEERELELATSLRRDFGPDEGPTFALERLDLGFSDEPVPISDDTAEASWVAPRGGFLVACFPAGTCPFY
jgi:aminobenzoyl-glutamate utilization protein B